MRARVPYRRGDHAGLRSLGPELGAGEGAQRARGEPGAQGQVHPGRGKGLGRGQAAAPRCSGGQVDVGGVGRVAQQKGLEILDARPQQRLHPGIVACRPRRRQRAGRRSAHGAHGSRSVRPHPQFDGHASARGQRELPAQQPRGGQRIGGRRVGGHSRASSGGRPAQAGVVDGGGEFRSCVAARDRTEVGQVRTQGDLDRQTQGSNGCAVQRDSLGTVRMTGPLDHDVRVRSRLRGTAQRAHEPGAVGRGHPGLDRERFASGHPDLAAREDASACSVEPVESPAGQLPLVCGDDEAR